jgi:predicted transposase/invertase (TIGR01784 family)
MAHYLDPKNDFIFKRIFGNHPDLLISFLNALMPFAPGRYIESITYVSNELVPNNPARKFSVVDVRCTDNYGRQFIVEMQMEWSNVFSSRMLFNASKTYVQQLDRSEKYASLSPVYALGILNENFDHKTQEFYHRYQIANRENTEEVIGGIELILVELPKFKAERWSDRKMAVLWLRFLREIKENVKSVSEDLLTNEDIRKAVDICEESGFTPEELIEYDWYWDAIRTEKSLLAERWEKGMEKGHEEGRKEGLEEGRKEGELQKNIQTVLNCAKEGLTIEFIAKVTGLPIEEIIVILEKNGLNK